MLPDDITCIRIEPDELFQIIIIMIMLISKSAFFQRVLLPGLTAKFFSEPVVQQNDVSDNKCGATAN